MIAYIVADGNSRVPHYDSFAPSLAPNVKGRIDVREELIEWYEQRMAVEKNKDARAIMENAQQEEFKHFGMDLEFLLRQKPKWRVAMQKILFQPGDIVENGEKAEDAEEEVS